MKKTSKNEFDGQKLIDYMGCGQKEAVLQGLKHGGALYRVNGIINAARYQMTSKDIVQEILLLLEDEVKIMGIKVCDFAIAALDILGHKKYDGNDEYIMRMILSKFDI